MMLRPKLALLFVPALALVALGCSGGRSTDFVQVWHDEAYEGPIRKIAIVGMSDNEAVRRNFEDGLAAQFREQGVEAVSSARIIPADREEDKEFIRSVIEREGIDAALITRLMSVDEQTEWLPGATQAARSTHYDEFYGEYMTTYEVVNDPGYLVNHQVVKLETNIYDTRSREVIWAGISESFNPDSSDRIIQELGKRILKDLASAGMIPR